MRTVIIGAGLSGLTAARELSRAGHDVTVLDKGRGVGGRLATRRMGDAVLDHGAQFFTVRSQLFGEHVAGWVADGVVHEWCRGFSGDDGHPRYVGSRGMTGIAKHLAAGLDVRTGVEVSSLAEVGGVFAVHSHGGETWECDRLLLTAPVPQTRALIAGLGIDVPPALREGAHDMTVCLLAVLDSPRHAVPSPGGLQNPVPELQFVGDNMAKGISPLPALTFHFSPAFSRDHFDDDSDALHALLIRQASRWLGDARIVQSEVKKWRYATPLTVHPDPFWASSDGRVVTAGDAFAGPRVEAAALSGIAAAAHLVA